MKKKLAILLSLLLPVFGFSAETTSFKSWNLLCGEHGNCSLSQVVAMDKAATQILMGVNVNYSASNLFPVLMLRLPAKIHKQGGVGIKIDDNKAIQVPITQCNAKACQSMIKIDDVLLKEMKNGKVGMIAFALESKKQLTLPISLEGFEAGFKTLKSKRVLSE